MNMELIKTLKYIFRNLIDRKQCEECGAHWFYFNHEAEKAYYRLGELAPSQCETCKPIDESIESESLATAERWFNL
jgi:hypothetical protein